MAEARHLRHSAPARYLVAVTAFTPLPLGRIRDPFDDRGTLYELKLDGFRALAFVDRGRSQLVSRNGNRFRRFDALAATLARSVRATSAVLDGEVVCLDDDGRPDFRALLFHRAEPYFVAFDLLALDGEDLRDQPLLERKRELRRLLGQRRGGVRYLSHVMGRGVELFAAVCERDLEGIVAKPATSPYRLVGERSPWLKIKNRNYSHARDRWELFEGSVRGRRVVNR